MFGLAAGGCTTPPKKKPAQEKKPAKVKPGQEATDVDFDGFIGRLRKAVTTHDMNTIAQMMTADFGYSLNPEKSGEGVFQVPGTRITFGRSSKVFCRKHS